MSISWENAYTQEGNVYIQTIKDLSCGDLYRSIIFFLINILIVCSLARIILHRGKSLRWIPFFLAAMAINVVIAWVFLFLILVLPSSLGLPDFYAEWILIYLAGIPYAISERLFELIEISENAQGVLEDILARLWFIFITFALTGFLYLGGKLRNKYFKKSV